MIMVLAPMKRIDKKPSSMDGAEGQHAKDENS